MTSENMTTEVAPGDKVSWSWGNGNPTGTVEEVQPNDITITTHRGNEVKKTGSEDNPAVRLNLGGGKPAVKQSSELEVEKPGPNHDLAGSTTTMNDTNGKFVEKKGLEVPNGRGKSKSKSPAPPAKKDTKEEEKPSEKEEEKKREDKPAEKEETKPAEDKKEETKANGAAAEKKKPGRKAGGGASAKPKAEKPKKRAATETGEPRRSKRGKTE